MSDHDLQKALVEGRSGEWDQRRRVGRLAVVGAAVVVASGSRGSVDGTGTPQAGARPVKATYRACCWVSILTARSLTDALLPCVGASSAIWLESASWGTSQLMKAMSQPLCAVATPFTVEALDPCASQQTWPTRAFVVSTDVDRPTCSPHAPRTAAARTPTTVDRAARVRTRRSPDRWGTARVHCTRFADCVIAANRQLAGRSGKPSGFHRASAPFSPVWTVRTALRATTLADADGWRTQPQPWIAGGSAASAVGAGRRPSAVWLPRRGRELWRTRSRRASVFRGPGRT